MATAVMQFVRDFGLLQPDRTPCGQPITVTQAHALASVAATPGLTQRELGARLGLARATTSELVADLTGRGWLSQHLSEHDRRQRCLLLTAAGQRIADDITRARQDLMRSLLSGVTAKDRARVVDAVELLARTVLQHRARNGGPIQGEGVDGDTDAPGKAPPSRRPPG